MQQQDVTFLDRSSDLDQELARERAAEMSTITKSMRTIKNIYEDLALIVDDQQDDIDDIEMNATQTKERTEAGIEQLEKAASISRSNQRSQSICMKLIILVVVIAVIVIIFTAHK